MARPTTTRSGCGPATVTASPSPAPRRGRRAARVLSLLCAVAMPLALLPPQVGWVPPIPQVILLQPALAALALGLAVIALVRRDLPSLVMSGLGVIVFLAIWVMPVWPTSAHESVSSAGQAEGQPSAGAPAADAATMASDELTIMTINTHVGQADPAQILQLVRDHQVDVLCVQESTVAFARALAPEPELLLLDEPFAAIDAKVRKELRGWLRRTIRQLGVTSIFVTHDQDEAVEVADDIVILERGHVEQMGTPVEIYQQPRTPFVANFIGEAMHIPDYTIFKGFENEKAEGAHEGILRPEFLEIGANDHEMRLPLASEDGIVRGVYFRGSNAEIDVEVKGQLLKGTRSLEKKPLHEGDAAKVFIHRIYSFAGGRTQILENRAKQVDSVVI